MHAIEIHTYRFQDVVNTLGVNEHFASFLTDEEVANASSTCKAANGNLLIDAIWRGRLIASKVPELVDIGSDPCQWQVYKSYARHFNRPERVYKRGAERGIEIFERVRYLTVVLRYMPSDDLSRSMNWFELKALQFGFIFCGGALCRPVFYGPSYQGRFCEAYGLEDPRCWGFAYMTSGVISVMATLTILLIGRTTGIPQRIGGNAAVLRVKALRAIKQASNCHKNGNCRITTCWQAVSRGMHRLRSWMWGGHED